MEATSTGRPVLINKALIEIPTKFAGRSPVNPVNRMVFPMVIARTWHGAQGLPRTCATTAGGCATRLRSESRHLYAAVEITYGIGTWASWSEAGLRPKVDGDRFRWRMINFT